jgi:hypothetical protein
MGTGLLANLISIFTDVLGLLFDWRSKSILFKSIVIGITLTLLITISLFKYGLIHWRSDNGEALHIKDVPSSIYPYSNTESGELFPYGVTLLRKSADEVDYRVNFTLPEKGDANVGLAFDFDKKEDLSIYKWIVLTVAFGDDDIGCQLFLRDAANNDDAVTLTRSSGQTLDGNEKTFKISLDQSFKDVDLSIVKSIFLVTGSQQIPNRGSHFLIVHDIEFLKE